MALPLDNLYLGIQEKEPAVIGTCAHCKEEVREGEEAFVCDTVHVHAECMLEYVDGEKIKADTRYRLKNGEFVEVE